MACFISFKESSLRNSNIIYMYTYNVPGKHVQCIGYITQFILFEKLKFPVNYISYCHNFELIVGQNLIHELPESFGNLKSLKICQLSKNKLELLPSSFGNLSALQDLRLDNNAVSQHLYKNAVHTCMCTC